MDGYWDYPLRQRGVLFTPVYFSAAVYGRPGFVYTPRYVVYDDACPTGTTLELSS